MKFHNPDWIKSTWESINNFSSNMSSKHKRDLGVALLAIAGMFGTAFICTRNDDDAQDTPLIDSNDHFIISDDNDESDEE